MKKILLIILTLQIAIAQAAEDVDLYSGEVVVASQSDADRKEAVPEALIQVLQKLSGKRELPATPALDEALENAESLMLSFRYKTVDRSGPDGTMTAELRMVARFMRPEVDRLAQMAGLPRWQQERPPVQIWVIIDDGRNRNLKPVEFEYAWEAMEELAATRGLSLSWPDFDEEQMQLIDMGLVWGGFTDYLVERGAPGDGIVIIAARREGPQWTLRWSLANGERNWNWRNNDRELMFALAAGVHQMADQMAAVDAIAVSEQGLATVEITIGRLKSANDYARCLGYLQNLSLVNDVEVLAAEPGAVRFRLQLNATSEYLSEAFNRGSVLLPARSGSEYDYEFLR